MNVLLLPQLALIGAAFCYALTALIARKFPFENPLQLATASIVIGTAFMVATCFATGDALDFAEVSALSLIAMVYLGLGPTALAALIYFFLIPRIGAGRLQQVNYVVPVLGTILGIIVLGETPEPNMIIAIVCVVLAVYLVSRKDGHRAAKPGNVIREKS